MDNNQDNSNEGLPDLTPPESQDRQKSRFEQAKDRLRQAAQAAKARKQIAVAQKILAAIGRALAQAAAYVAGIVGWPVLTGCLVVFLIVMMIFGSMFCIAANKYFGKSAVVTLDRKTDKKLVLKGLAAAGDQGAKRELIVIDAEKIKTDLKKINATNNPEAQKTLKSINQHLDALMSLSDSDAAITQKSNQIVTLLDNLKKQLPDQAGAIESVKTEVLNLQKMMEFYQRGHLVLNPKDMDYIRNYDVDKRILQMLVYLVTPIDQGGAGYERIKVKRIKFSYDTTRKSESKETDYSDNEEPNISAHYSGQAADITEIDNIKCTQIKRRRIGSDKKTKMPPTPIKVAWQTEEGFIKGNGLDAYGQNMHQVFNNFGTGAIDDVLAAQISDILGVDLDPEKLKGKTLPEISRYVGTALLKETLDIPGDYDLGNNLEDIVRGVGRAYLAKALNVPFEGIKGNSPEEISENVGRSLIEEKMSLPEGSLEGANSGEIFASAGRRYMEESLGLSRNTLATPYTPDTFKQVLGQGRLEFSLGLTPQTFAGNSLNDIKKKMGKDGFEEIFANPESIDNWLGLATGTTDSFLESRLSPDDFKYRVGEKVYQDQIAIYQKDEKRAEAYGISSGDMAAFSRGDNKVFVSIGKTAIAQNLTSSDKEQELLLTWFNSKQIPKELDENYLAGQYGLKADDLGKIFVDDLGKDVFQRVGQTTILDNLSNNPELNRYLEPVQEYKFYQDRVDTISNNLDYLATKSSDSEIRAKAADSKKIIDKMLQMKTVGNIKANVKQLQINLKFIKERAEKTDPKALERVRQIQKAINEIIQGRELPDYDSLSPDTMTAKTDPQVGLKKKDVYDLIRGRKSVDDLVYAIGLRKWEIEFDLPDNSLKNAFTDLKKSNFENADSILLINMGKSRLTEYGSITFHRSETVDRELALPAGTTANYKSGKITKEAFYKAVGMGVANNTAANLLNKQLQLTDDPNYALQGADITKTLNGGWFFTTLKIGGNAIDKSFGLPAGGTLDVIQQSEASGDVLGHLAEQKLGAMAGLNRAVSLNGDITYNLGRVKIERELGLKHNELNDGNVAAKIRNYTDSDNNSLSVLDVTFGLKPGLSKQLINGQTNSHNYIKDVGGATQNNVFYDTIADFAPAFKNQDVKSIVLAFANKTGTPQEIMEAAGANQVGKILGLDYPVSIRGNFKDNLGQAKIEDRLGLVHDSFKDNINNVIKLNGNGRFESAFYLESGQLKEAMNANSGYWSEDRANDAKVVDAILNIPNGNTQDFITGKISLADFVDKVGQNSMKEVAVDKIADLLDLEPKYLSAAQTLVYVLNRDPSLKDPRNQALLFNSLMGLTGKNLDNMTKFDPGTWERILFTDPDDPEHTGIKNAGTIVLEQGKKWLPRWMGLNEGYDPYIDLIYEQGTGIRDEQVMTTAIQQITGIPDENDAKRFLHGDFRGGAMAWGAAQIVDMYNKEFKDQGATFDYYTAKTAYFNDPEGEKAIGEAAVEDLREVAGGEPLDPEIEKVVYQEAVREARDNARKDVQYKMVDVQLHKMDKNIPAGFTATMREGDSNEKWQMGLTYIGNMVHEQNPAIPAELLPNLQQYFDPNSPQYHDPDALSGTTYAFLDGQMKTTFGDFIQPGTAQALFIYGKTGRLGELNERGTLANIYGNYGINIVTHWADKTLGLPAGSTKIIYESYTKYRAALKAYQTARALHQAGKITQTALQAAEADLTNIKIQIIATVVTFVFQKQLAAVDESLGLVPGSSAMAVGMLAELWIKGAISPWSIALFVAINLFGVYRVDVVCTACGYYPSLGGPVPNQSCPLGEFDGLSSDSFKMNSVAAAKYKVNKLIGDILQMPTVLKNPNLLPTQIMTLRQEDVDDLTSRTDELFGSAFSRGNTGLWANQLMWDHIHIGY